MRRKKTYLERSEQESKMGGCRCTFRDCTNNTVNSPGKHFFHFPYKDNERCKKWAINSDKISFLHLPWTQLRNKTVCEDHFVDGCFMNFKRERLVKTAIPTLHRTKAGGILDIQLDESKVSALEYYFNDKGTDQQTIDLPDSQPLKRTIHVNLSVDENPSADDEFTDTIVVSEASPSFPLAIAPVSGNCISDDSKPVVLNRVCSSGVKRFPMQKMQTKPHVKRKEVYAGDDNEAVFTPNKRIKSEFSDKGANVVGRTYGKSNIINPMAMRNVQEPEHILPAIDNGLNEAITANILEKINHIEERDANKVDKSLYMQMMTEHAKQIEDLKKLLTDKLTDKNKDTSNQGDLAAHSSTDARTIRIEKGPAMTKVHLFNGIRKYLNPTMVALLRMEMFGSSDREYRPDERQLSKELYSLNQNVYEYMRDEWRFRLPPKTDVEEWLKQPDDEETWELC